MANETYSFEVGKEATKVTVNSWGKLISWLETEKSKWDWLQRGGETDLPNQWASTVQNQWDQILNSVRQYEAQGYSITYAENAVQPLSAGGQLLVSTSADGIHVLDIRSSLGDVGAAFAYAFLKGSVEWSTVRRTDALLGILLTALPDMRDAALMAAELKQERKRFQDSLRSGMSRLDDSFRTREVSFDALVERGKAVALRTLRTRKSEWKEQQDSLSEQSTAAVADINAVREAYLQFMQLRAPVEYWTEKSRAHKNAAGMAARNLAVYFIILTLVLGGAFYAAGAFLLSLSIPPGAGNMTAIYVVISGGLAILSTVGFWVGRLYTKLYLSEHHLRTDADERAVMTQTYLALTKENAATDAERQIILTALFRTSSDGIVKDDGPPDMGMQSILSKALSR